MLKELIKKEYSFLILLILLLFIPLYPKFPLAAIGGTYVAIRLEDIVIALILGFWVVTNFKKIKVDLFKSTIYKVFLLFWFITFVSLLSGVFITHSLSFNLGFFHFLRRVEVMSLFFVAASAIKNRVHIKAILISMLIATIIIVIYGLGQLYLKFPVVSTTNKEFSKGLIISLTPGARPNSSFAGHYDLAAYLSIVLVFLGTLFFYYSKMKEKGLIILTGFFSFILLGLTAARMSFATTLLGVTLAFWMIKKRILIILLVIFTLGAVLGIPELRHRLVATLTVNLLGGGGAKYQPSPNAIGNFTPIAQNATKPLASAEESTSSATSSAVSVAPSVAIPSDIAPGEPTNYTELEVSRSTKIRTDVEWPRAIRAFNKNPLLGTGYSSITIATDNDFLRSLGETGLLGTLSLILIFVAVFKKLFSNLKRLEKFERFFIISAICATITILATGLVIDLLEASKIASILWIMLGVSWAISSNYEAD